MKQWIIPIATSIVLASGCLPTREQTPFGEDPDNNMMPDAGNNVPGDGGNNIPGDAGNNVPGDTGNNVPGDAGNNVPGDTGNDMGMGGEDLGADMCIPEDNTTFCTRQGAGCGDFTSADNCGDMRTVDCGNCPNQELCNNNVCEGCTPESDDDFCARLSAECGQIVGLDNCRMQRTVNCGGCPGNGTGCNLMNECVETQCRDGVDNDGANGADCDDPNCLGQQCSPSPVKVCTADGSCS